MAKVKVVKSLANTGVKYLEVPVSLTVASVLVNGEENKIPKAKSEGLYEFLKANPKTKKIAIRFMDGGLKIQAKGKEANRGYGYSGVTGIPKKLLKFLKDNNQGW